MKDCIFCGLAGAEVSPPPLYSDGDCFVVKDINPKSKTHLLIISRRHIASIAEISSADADLVGHLIFCAKKMADKLELPGYKLLINVGEGGGQEIFHLHVHLMSNFG